jgi:hypothetical protein
MQLGARHHSAQVAKHMLALLGRVPHHGHPHRIPITNVTCSWHALAAAAGACTQQPLRISVAARRGAQPAASAPARVVRVQAKLSNSAAGPHELPAARQAGPARAAVHPHALPPAPPCSDLHARTGSVGPPQGCPAAEWQRRLSPALAPPLPLRLALRRHPETLLPRRGQQAASRPPAGATASPQPTAHSPGLSPAGSPGRRRRRR